MALQIPNGYALARLHYLVTGDSEEMITTFGLDIVGSPTAAAVAAELAVDVTTAVSGAGGMYNEWQFVRVTIALGTGGAPLLAEHAVNTQGTRGAVATPPPNSAVLIRKVTGVGGRKHRGRLYFPPCTLAESNVTSAGFLTSGEMTSQQTDWNNLLGAIQAGTNYNQMVVLHNDATTPTAVTALIVSNQVATQRRRLRR